ncbi:MAG: hypothetical protein MJ172_07125 [Clostridia bacterium]|nr:hypothetical protein [Clostridia bacterium]
MNEIVKLKSEIDDLQIEYDILSSTDIENIGDERYLDIINQIESVDQLISEKQRMIDDINSQIDILTNHADGIDYTIAVACGVLTGLIDVFLVGEFDFESSYADISKKVDAIVEKQARQLEKTELEQNIKKQIKNAHIKAKEKGKVVTEEQEKEIRERLKNSFKDKHDLEKKLNKAIEKAKEKGEVINSTKKEEIRQQLINNEKANNIKILERAFGLPSDNIFEGTGDGISAKSHHLDDLAHHPTVIGWAVSIMMQFTNKAYFQNKDGKNIAYTGVKKVKVIDNVNAYIKYGDVKTIEKITKSGKVRSALEVTLIGDDLESKLACGTFNWIGHLLSDIAGSSSSARKGRAGMGLPGPMLSTLKEFAMLPIIKSTGLPQFLNDLFTKDDAIFGKYRLDLRSELAIGKELGKQAIPVILNEVLVRLSFFMHRFIDEARNAHTIRDICWKNTLPFKNRTITRMLTISLGTLEAIDMADAAIRGTISGSLDQFILRINFVGVGRFAIACFSDIKMGIERDICINDRIKLYNEQLYLLEAKVYFYEAGMWVSAENAVKATEELYKYLNEIIPNLLETNNSVIGGLENLQKTLPNALRNNPELMEQMRKKLRR